MAPNLSLRTCTVAELKTLFSGTAEFAVIDVRGQGAFSEKNLFQATTLPLGHLELLLPTAIPRHGVRVVVVSGSDDGLAEIASRRLSAWGYSDVSTLEGGVEGWESAGLPVYSGTHVRSKAFSEVLEHELKVPWIDFAEFDRRRKSGSPVALFDSRSFPEYQRVTVPGATSLPGAELVRHIHDQVPDASTLVVVTCGGRTRSIIGAQALINAGVPNRVVSLKDGTMGLRRDQLPMETGATRRPLQASSASLAWARRATEALARKAAIRTLSQDGLRALVHDDSRTLYVFDVRTPEEYLAGHLAGSVSAQSGQLVQEIDTYAPVWNARIVLVDDEDLIRARMTASWLIQMGCPDVMIYALSNEALEIGAQPQRVLGLAPSAATPTPPQISVTNLATGIERGRVNVVDLATSPNYKAGHIPGAYFITRVRLPECLRKLPPRDELVLTSDNGILAQLAAADLALQGVTVSILAGGTQAWRDSGRPLTQGAEKIADVIDDAWLPPPQREGDVKAAIIEYLDWELGLPEQVSHDTSVQFHVSVNERVL